MIWLPYILKILSISCQKHDAATTSWVTFLYLINETLCVAKIISSVFTSTYLFSKYFGKASIPFGQEQLLITFVLFIIRLHYFDGLQFFFLHSELWVSIPGTMGMQGYLTLGVRRHSSHCYWPTYSIMPLLRKCWLNACRCIQFHYTMYSFSFNSYPNWQATPLPRRTTLVGRGLTGRVPRRWGSSPPLPHQLVEAPPPCVVCLSCCPSYPPLLLPPSATPDEQGQGVGRAGLLYVW